MGKRSKDLYYEHGKNPLPTPSEPEIQASFNVRDFGWKPVGPGKVSWSS